MSFIEQMANVGSEVERALNWLNKGNKPYSQRAFERALELVDLTLAANCASLSRLKEVARVREALVDYFFGSNEYHSTEQQWKKYFFYFALAARKNY